MRVHNYEILVRGESNDLLSTLGFLTAVRDCCRVQEGGVVWAGVPCSRCSGNIIMQSTCCSAKVCECECAPIHVTTASLAAVPSI